MKGENDKWIDDHRRRHIRRKEELSHPNVLPELEPLHTSSSLHNQHGRKDGDRLLCSKLVDLGNVFCVRIKYTICIQ